MSRALKFDILHKRWYPVEKFGRHKMSKDFFNSFTAATLMVVAGVPTGGVVIDAIKQPLKEDGLAIYKDGKVRTTGYIPSLSTYDFANATIINGAGVNAPVSVSPVQSLSVAQKANYDAVHHKACQIVQGHPEYATVCTGLSQQPS